MIDFPEPAARVISCLPMAHIAERSAHHYLPDGLRAAGHLLPGPARDHRLPAGGAADLVLRGAADLGEAEGRAGGDAWRRCPDEQRAPAEQALEAALEKVRLEQAGEEVPEELAAARRAGRRARCSRSCARRSGSTRLMAVNVGAAPTPLEVLEFFHAIGIPIGELWGMSETCGARTCNPPGAVKLGTVGPPAPGRRDQARRRRRGAGQGADA